MTPPKKDPQPLSDTHWTFKKEIQITHVISTIAIAFSAFMYVNHMEKRLTLLEEKNSVQRDRDNQQDQQFNSALSQITTQIAHIDAKLDRLVERNMK